MKNWKAFSAEASRTIREIYPYENRSCPGSNEIKKINKELTLKIQVISLPSQANLYHKDNILLPSGRWKTKEAVFPQN